MTLLAMKERGIPKCKESHDSAWGEPADYVCTGCGQPICKGHTVECFYCHNLQKPAWYCGQCAGVHEVSRSFRGQCIDEFRNEWNDFRGMQQRRSEKYKQMGLL